MVSLFPAGVDNQTALKLFIFEHGLPKDYKTIPTIKTMSWGKLVYQPTNSKLSWFTEQFPTAEFYPTTQINFESLGIQSTDTEYKCWIQLYHDQMEFVIMNKSEVIFTNQFVFSTSEDVLYFLLYTLQQLKITPTAVSTFISGDLKDTQLDTALLKKYIPALTIVEKSDHLSHIETEALTAEYINVIHLLLCE